MTDDSLKKEIELCYKKLEGLDEMIDKLKADNVELRRVADWYRLMAIRYRHAAMKEKR